MFVGSDFLEEGEREEDREREREGLRDLVAASCQNDTEHRDHEL